jgi:hypothetical protein
MEASVFLLRSIRLSKHEKVSNARTFLAAHCIRHAQFPKLQDADP